MAKLDWIPLYIHRLKASRRWQEMQDFERGWYITLLIESADSERPGYLPNDPMVLWRLAGAKTMAYFQREGQSVLACFDGRTDDGRWIYNGRMLETLTEQIEKKDRKVKVVTPSISLIGYSQVSDLFLKAYENYPRHVGKRAAEKAFTSALARHVKNGEVSKTAEMIAEKSKVYAETPAGQRGSYTPHMSTWLNQDRFLDDEREWFTEPIDGRPQQTSKQLDRISKNREAIARALEKHVAGDLDRENTAALRAGINGDSGNGHAGRLEPPVRQNRPARIREDAE